MANGGPTGDGLVNWLIWIVVTLMATFLGFVQRHFGGRLSKVEDKAEACEAAMHTIESTLTDKMTDNNDAWHRRFEDRRKENKQDFKDLHAKIDSNQETIIDTLNKMK